MIFKSNIFNKKTRFQKHIDLSKLEVKLVITHIENSNAKIDFDFQTRILIITTRDFNLNSIKNKQTTYDDVINVIILEKIKL